MNTLTAFLRPNVEQLESVKYAASPRIRGENGKAVEWEIRCIGSDEYARIRSDCTRQVPVPGKKNQYTQQVDLFSFQARVCAACTVFPPLTDAALQTSWGVATPEALLGKLLTPGEFDDYVVKVFEVNDFKGDAELVDEAKN